MDQATGKRNVRYLIAEVLSLDPSAGQAKLAKALGVNESTVSRWRRVDGGDTPGRERWPAIEEALGMPSGALDAAYLAESPELIALDRQLVPAEQVVSVLLSDYPQMTEEEARSIVARALAREPEPRPTGRRAPAKRGRSAHDRRSAP